MVTVATVGHGTRSIRELIDILRSARIDVLIDVRRFPGSRRHPHFSKPALERSLRSEGIDYEWHGETLGGRRQPDPSSVNRAWRNASFRAYADHMATEVFQGALEKLEERGATTRTAIMCAETLWWRCHRRLIADALVARGHEVIHLGLGKNDVSHELHEAARLTPDGTLLYDREHQGHLPI